MFNLTEVKPERRLRITRLFAYFTFAVFPSYQIVATERLPATPSFKGEIRRDASGVLIAVPGPKPSNAGHSEEGGGVKVEQTAHKEAILGAKTDTKSSPTMSFGSSQERDLAAGWGLRNITIQVGKNRKIKQISDAAKTAKNGDTIEVDAGDYVADVAVWTQDNLKIKGVGGRPRLIAAGASAEGKAIWVVRGGRVDVENVEFSGAKVPDKNGAGIRFEKGVLTVKNCAFFDNENGILTASGELDLKVDGSEFGRNGAGDGLSHGMYVGAIKRLIVSGSYFHHGNVGHLLKSRAEESHVLYNRLTDEIGGKASYELDFPNGGLVYVIGNVIQQSSQTENTTIVSYGAEGYKRNRNELYLVNNTMVDDVPNGGTFLRVAAGPIKLKAVNNLLLGQGSLEEGKKQSLFGRAKSLAKQLLDRNEGPQERVKGDFHNNINVDLDMFAQPSRHDYRVRTGKQALLTFVEPGSADGFRLSPSGEYIHPTETKPLLTVPKLPGAMQTIFKE